MSDSKFHRRRERDTKPSAADFGDKTPPHDAAAERRILGAILVDFEGTVLPRAVSRQLKASDFYDAKHQLIFEAIEALHGAGSGIDEIVLCDRLQAMSQLQEAGGPSYVDELTRGGMDGLSNALHWVDIILEKSRRRQLIVTTMELMRKAFDPASPVSELAATGVSKLVTLERAQSEGEESCGKVVDAVTEKWRRAIAGEPPPYRRTVSWGLDDMDRNFTPLCAEQGDGLVIIAARSGVGKSSLARQMVHHLLKTDESAIAQVFLLETQAQQLVARMAGLESGIPYNESLDGRALARWRGERRRLVRTGQSHGQPERGESFEAFQQRAEEAWFSDQAATHTGSLKWLSAIADKRLFVRAHTYDIDAICAQARAIHRITGRTDLVVVDYLQIVDISDGEGRQGYEVIKHIAMRLKQLAKDLGAPVIAIAAVTVEGDSIPGLEDIRASKDAGYAADRIVMLHRPLKDATGADQTDDRAVIHVQARQVKARDAGVYTLWAGFVRQLTKFMPTDRHYSATSATSEGTAKGRGRPLGAKDSAPRAAYGSLKDRPRQQMTGEDPPASALFDND